jgi:NAD+ kinase
MKYFLINNTSRKTYNELYGAHLQLTDKVEDADAILVIGGDGSLLHAIAKYQELDKPFIGIHGGTRGYLMNNVETPEQFINCINDVEYESLWMLDADITTLKSTTKVHAFNDIWVNRATPQTLRMEISIDGVIQPAMIIGDGMLFCTPQGSTGYNMALRGKIISPGVPVLQMTPISCVVNKTPLGSVILSDTCEVSVDFLQTDKRPGYLFFDGIQYDSEVVKNMTVRKSKRTIKIGLIERYSVRNKVTAWLFNT